MRWGFQSDIGRVACPSPAQPRACDSTMATLPARVRISAFSSATVGSSPSTGMGSTAPRGPLASSASVAAVSCEAGASTAPRQRAKLAPSSAESRRGRHRVAVSGEPSSPQPVRPDDVEPHGSRPATRADPVSRPAPADGPSSWREPCPRRATAHTGKDPHPWCSPRLSRRAQGSRTREATCDQGRSVPRFIWSLTKCR